MSVSTLEELYVDELKDLYNAEKQLTKALPKMAKKATDAQLQSAFEKHLRETENHVVRLEKIFEDMEKRAAGKTCDAMKGLIEEADKMIKEVEEGPVRDAAMIGMAQKVEHYEIAGYGTVLTYANQLGHTKHSKLLEQTLNEEKATDEKLTELAESGINQMAENEA